MKEKTQKKSYNLLELVGRKDEIRIKELIVLLIRNIAKNKFQLHELFEISYMYDDIIVSIPMQLGWKEKFIIKDKWLNDALEFIVNLEGDTVASASKKAKKILKKLNS